MTFTFVSDVDRIKMNQHDKSQIPLC